MTRKDYVLIADVISLRVSLTYSKGGALALKLLAEDLATELKRDNPRFNRETFLAACKLR